MNEEIKSYYLLIFILLSFLIKNSISQIPAFPGAEGFGSTTPGGRYGKVIFVTNLNSDGPGSLREACASFGPRIIIFKVGGIIDIKRPIIVSNPYVTIAGQTAPGDGITIKGAALTIMTHDVIVRGLRIRVGDDPNGPDPEDRDAIQVHNKNEILYNVIIDHCSFSWAIDENIAFWYTVKNSTVQWSITSEALRYSLHPQTIKYGDNHSCGLLVGKNSKNISIHHNLFANNYRRNPATNYYSEVEIINNLIYNYKLGTTVGGLANIIGNVYKPGPETGKNKGIKIPTWSNLVRKIYVKNNIGPGRIVNDGDDWLIVDGSEKHRSIYPLLPPSNIKIDPVDSVYRKILEFAGAIIPHRDPVDQRIIQDIINGSGKFIDSQNEIGGWPKMRTGTPSKDSDLDGMPDDWEIAHHLDPNDPGDQNLDSDGNGYTNIEDYINSFFQIYLKERINSPKKLRIKN